MKRFCVFATATGEILRHGTIPASMLELQASVTGEGVLESDGMFNTHYVDVAVTPNVVTPKAEMSLSVVGTTISGLPIPCTARYGNQVWEVEDGEIELDFPFPGTYEVRLSSVRFLDTTVRVTK